MPCPTSYDDFGRAGARSRTPGPPPWRRVDSGELPRVFGRRAAPARIEAVRVVELLEQLGRIRWHFPADARGSCRTRTGQDRAQGLLPESVLPIGEPRRYRDKAT